MRALTVWTSCYLCKHTLYANIHCRAVQSQPACRSSSCASDVDSDNDVSSICFFKSSCYTLLFFASCFGVLSPQVTRDWGIKREKRWLRRHQFVSCESVMIHSEEVSIEFNLTKVHFSMVHYSVYTVVLRILKSHTVAFGPQPPRRLILWRATVCSVEGNRRVSETGGKWKNNGGK